MASDVLGSQLDIHSDGLISRSLTTTATSRNLLCEHGKGEHICVNYFLHMGRLSISGSNMSNSLKNFQTIRDALATTDLDRGMRIALLLGRLNDGVEISPEMRLQADNWEATISVCVKFNWKSGLC